MRLYWKENRRGLDLVVEDDSSDVHIIGGVRDTNRGVEAMAKVLGYDPSRAIKGLSSVDEGRKFVENIRPWLDFFPGTVLDLEQEVVPLPKEPKENS